MEHQPASFMHSLPLNELMPFEPMKNSPVMRPLFRIRILVLTILNVTILAPLATRADLLTWTAGSGNWSSPSNWSPARAPQNGDDLVFNNSPMSYLTNDIP